jgi:hypothetical protein
LRITDVFGSRYLANDLSLAGYLRLATACQENPDGGANLTSVANARRVFVAMKAMLRF